MYLGKPGAADRRSRPSSLHWRRSWRSQSRCLEAVGVGTLGGLRKRLPWSSSCFQSVSLLMLLRVGRRHHLIQRHELLGLHPPLCTIICVVEAGVVVHTQDRTQDHAQGLLRQHLKCRHSSNFLSSLTRCGPDSGTSAQRTKRPVSAEDHFIYANTPLLKSACRILVVSLPAPNVSLPELS